MKFSQVAKGRRQEKAASFLYGTTPVQVLLRPLSLAEEMEAAAVAIKAAKAKGAEPGPGTTIYDGSHMAAVLAIGCLDPDSPEGERAPLFDQGPDQIAKELDPDTIALLFEQHQLFQEQVSPMIHSVGIGQLFSLAKQLSEEEHDPLAFLRLSRRMQLTLLRFTVALAFNSQRSSSSPGSSSETTPAEPPSDASPTSPEESKPPEGSPSSPTPRTDNDGPQ